MSGNFNVEGLLNKRVCENCLHMDECEGRKYYCPAYEKLKEILEGLMNKPSEGRWG